MKVFVVRACASLALAIVVVGGFAAVACARGLPAPEVRDPATPVAAPAEAAPAVAGVRVPAVPRGAEPPYVERAGLRAPAWQVGTEWIATQGAPPPPPPPGDPNAMAPRWSPPASQGFQAPVPASQANPAPTARDSRFAPPAERCWDGCGLLCEDGISRWHVRALGGFPWYFTEDQTVKGCSYWGIDFGRTHCGCWGYDIFYRLHGCQFERALLGTTATGRDGGYVHHLGAKLTWERSFAGNLYGFVGLGGSYYWTQDLIQNDTGFGLFGEAGIGYVINQTFRVRAGVDFHGLFGTTMTRKVPTLDGLGRDLWVVAAWGGVEIDF